MVLFALRKPFYEDFAKNLWKNENFSDSKTVQNKRCLKTKASYVVAVSLAKRCRPFEDGEFFKDLCNDVLMCFGDEAESIRSIANDIPLSSQTITRRTENISAFIYSNIKNRIAECKYFSICLDECSDINDIAQLLVYVKTVDNDLQVHEEMLSMVGLYGHVKGKTIYDINLSNTMEIFVKIINKIKGGHNFLNHRKFKQFLDEISAEYGYVLMFTNVCRLSKGRCLQ